ncbi:hypothetical protein MIMGU_mgv1a015063mg [Erythranthe guttata]|uniref:Transmembrane protein n=1 Tax=Erythranthe guttata TaxID=4155 RepID=A0A022QXU7_ERYGU|nr:hypothetical protein MIMGU_mgv1a015063mg [Erythranthe guttata]
MQRQSLGSPSSKLVAKDEQLIITNEITQLNNNKQFPPSISNNITGFMLFSQEQEEEEEQLKKKKKKMKKKNSSYIHLIPMLTLLCFLILYLSSHNPSQTVQWVQGIFQHCSRFGRQYFRVATSSGY